MMKEYRISHNYPSYKFIEVLTNLIESIEINKYYKLDIELNNNTMKYVNKYLKNA